MFSQVFFTLFHLFGKGSTFPSKYTTVTGFFPVQARNFQVIENLKKGLSFIHYFLFLTFFLL